MLSTQKRSHVLGSNASRLKDSVWASRTSMGKWQACFLGGVGDMGRSSFGYLKQHPLNVVTNGCNASAFITSPWTWGTLFFPLLAFAACFAMSSELERVRTEVNPLVWVSSGEPCLCASPFISVGSPDPSFTLRYLSENPLIDFVSLYKIREADVRNQK